MVNKRREVFMRNVLFIFLLLSSSVFASTNVLRIEMQMSCVEDSEECEKFLKKWKGGARPPQNGGYDLEDDIKPDFEIVDLESGLVLRAGALIPKTGHTPTVKEWKEWEKEREKEAKEKEAKEKETREKGD